MHYQDKFWGPAMTRYRVVLAQNLLPLFEQVVHPSNKERIFRAVRDPVPLFFEEMGALLRDGYLDLKMVWTLFGNPAPLYWAAMKEVVEYQRHEDPAYWTEFEYLVDRLNEVEIQRGETAEPDREEIKNFLNGEATME
jgi:hypothetical protein